MTVFSLEENSRKGANRYWEEKEFLLVLQLLRVLKIRRYWLGLVAYLAWKLIIGSVMPELAAL